MKAKSTTFFVILQVFCNIYFYLLSNNFFPKKNILFLNLYTANLLMYFFFKKNGKYCLIALLITLAIGLIISFLNHNLQGIQVWANMPLGNAGLWAEYCELNNMQKLVRQSINSYSNLIYLFLGIIVIGLSIKDFWSKKQHNTIDNVLKNHPIFSVLVGFSLVYLAAGSFFYHASLTYLSQRVDMAGTYSFTMSLLCISAYRLTLHQKNIIRHTATQILFFIAYIAFNILYLATDIKLKAEIVLTIFILFIFFINIIILFFYGKKSKYTTLFLACSLVSIIGAVTVRSLDVQKIACHPEGWYQGHALWHVLTACSGFFIYCFYRHEKANIF